MTAGSRTRTRSATYLTEDIVINILLWLPIASCIARFRCVCRSWRTLLSDPNFVRKILFSQKSDDQKSMQILFSGARDSSDQYYVPPLSYSVYSFETLQPIVGDLVSTLIQANGYSVVEGCCDGIFCIKETTRNSNGDFVHNILLWNPATSETKIIPACPFHPSHSSDIALSLRVDRIGFGYDPKTSDYKVVRVMVFEEGITDDDDSYDYDSSQFYHGPLPLVFTEVYSLKNNSWKTLDVTQNVVSQNTHESFVDETKYLHQQFDISRNEKCYWFREESPGILAIVSFDMSTEVFELVAFPQPVGLAHHDVDDPSNNTNSTMYHKDSWYIKSGFMLKNEVFIAAFTTRCGSCSRDTRPDDEIWVMLKYGVGESWMKLSTLPQPYYIEHLDVWKDGTYICSSYGDMSICDIVTGETIREHIQIQGTVNWDQANIFTPTQVSMSRLVNSS
ncbi:F-box/kelch-repeat protein At3g06240 [Linum perenne]